MSEFTLLLRQKKCFTKTNNYVKKNLKKNFINARSLNKNAPNAISLN